MAGYVKEMTAKNACKYGERGPVSVCSSLFDKLLIRKAEQKHFWKHKGNERVCLYVVKNAWEIIVLELRETDYLLRRSQTQSRLISVLTCKEDSI